jgi:hypothetical protein
MLEAPIKEQKSLAWDRSEATTDAPYRTFARTIPPSLATAAAVIALVGALGAWIRATQVKTETLGPQSAGTLWGYAEPSGRAIAVVAGVVAFIGLVTYFTRSRFLPRLSVEIATLILLVVLIGRLFSLDSRSADIAAAARQDPSFISFNAGFGWGAWLLLLAAVLAALALLVGGLRELDLKRGKPE